MDQLPGILKMEKKKPHISQEIKLDIIELEKEISLKEGKKRRVPPPLMGRKRR